MVSINVGLIRTLMGVVAWFIFGITIDIVNFIIRIIFLITVEQARSESKDSDEEIPDLEPTTRGNSSSPPKVVMRQKSNTPKSKKDNRLSYFDNEMQMLDSEQHEIDIQVSVASNTIQFELWILCLLKI